MSKNIWIDEKGNTCIGIRPELKNEPKKEEVKEDEPKKVTKSGRRKGPSK